MCRLQPRLMKATVKEVVDGSWPSDGQDTRFTPDEDPKAISRGVSDRSVCFPPSISDPYFNSIFLESQTRNPRGNEELLITQTCNVIIVRSSIYEVLQLARSDIFSLEDPTKTQDIQRGETRFQ